MTTLVLVDAPVEYPEPTAAEAREWLNRRPHCAGCGRFVRARTLRYVHIDRLICDCTVCGPAVGVAP
jgi:hypothetical protein